MKLAPLAVLLALSGILPAQASIAPTEPAQLKLNVATVSPAGAETLDLDIRTAGDLATANAAAARELAQSRPALAGAPMIQGAPQAEGVPGAPVIADTPASPVPAATPAAGTSATDLTPGEPVKVYTTLAAAAEAGIDPMGDLKLSGSAPTASPAAQFDWKNPQAYLEYMKTHQGYVLQGGLGLLVAGIALWLMRRRKA